MVHVLVLGVGDAAARRGGGGGHGRRERGGAGGGGGAGARSAAAAAAAAAAAEAVGGGCEARGSRVLLRQLLQDAHGDLGGIAGDEAAPGVWGAAGPPQRACGVTPYAARLAGRRAGTTPPSYAAPLPLLRSSSHTRRPEGSRCSPAAIARPATARGALKNTSAVRCLGARPSAPLLREHRRSPRYERVQQLVRHFPRCPSPERTRGLQGVCCSQAAPPRLRIFGANKNVREQPSSLQQENRRHPPTLRSKNDRSRGSRRF